MEFPRDRILCVEDDTDTAEMMKVLLEMSHYEVTLAQTAADGFYRASSEHFDLCLLNSYLPDESGFELCRRICEITGHAPVVFISGAAYESDKQRGLTVGALAYLTKPIDFEALERTMTRLIKGYRAEHLECLKDGRGLYHFNESGSGSGNPALDVKRRNDDEHRSREIGNGLAQSQRGAGSLAARAERAA